MSTELPILGAPVSAADAIASSPCANPLRLATIEGRSLRDGDGEGRIIQIRHPRSLCGSAVSSWLFAAGPTKTAARRDAATMDVRQERGLPPAIFSVWIHNDARLLQALTKAVW